MDRIDMDSQSKRQQPRPTETPPAPVAVVGMHRSGTSMVAKLLHEAGLHLGAEADLMPPAAENPEGFFEHLGFVRLNDEVLNAAGAGWDCPPLPGVDWGSGSFEPFRKRAHLLAEPLQAVGQWGWKDPRTSLTLPFWRSALGPLRTVVVVRNPLEVVTSLHRRNGFSIALALTLWQTYAERILQDTSPEGRLVTHYDAYFTDPEREIGRLLDYLGMADDRDAAALRAAAFPALRHHRKTMRDLEEHDFPSEVTALYGRLCQEAGWWEGGDPNAVELGVRASSGAGTSLGRGLGRVDLIRVENEALKRNNDDFVAALADREARIAELETALRNHEAHRDEIDGLVVERDGRVAERDSRLIERDALIARRDHALAVLQQQLAHNAAELSRLREQVTELSERLSERERSLAISEIHERDLRSMLTGLQAIQRGRDAEIMGTLGAVLSRHAPGAPASIYYRRLLGQVRRLVDAHVPSGASTLVATYGDGAMLALGDRPTVAFPQAASGSVADYTDVNAQAAVAQLQVLRDDGAEFLIVPSPALPWLASHPELERHLERHAMVVARERGVATIYDLGRQPNAIPA